MTQIGIVRAAVTTGATGTQDFRDPNMTETPSAALFILTNATVDGTPAATAQISFGAADGTNQWALNGIDEDGQASTNTSKRTAEDACIVVVNGSNVVIGAAAFSSFLSDAGSGAGVQINITNAFETAYLLTVILFSVSGAKVGSYTAGAAVNDTTAVTGLGFDPNVIVAACGGNAIPDGSAPILYSLGVAANGSGQECIGYRDSDGAAVAVPSFRIFDTRIAAQIDINGNVAWSSELTSWDTGGFTVTQRSLGGGGDEVGYLALDTGDRAAWAGVVTSPTSTGNQAITSPAFTPQFVLQLLTNAEATETPYTDNRAGSWGVGAFTANAEYSNVISVEDAVDTTNTQSLSDDVAANLPDDDGTGQCVAAFVSFDANGWTLNHSAVAATGKKWLALAIEATTTTVTGAVTMSGAGGLAGAALLTIPASAALSGAGDLSSAALITTFGAAVLAGAGDLSGAGGVTVIASATLPGVGDLAGQASVLVLAAATLAGNGDLAGLAILIIPGAATLDGAGALAGAGEIVVNGLAALAAAGDLAGAGQVTVLGSGTLSGIGAFGATSLVIIAAAATLAGSGNLSAIAFEEAVTGTPKGGGAASGPRFLGAILGPDAGGGVSSGSPGGSVNS